jgi:hypothetical protein
VQPEAAPDGRAQGSPASNAPIPSGAPSEEIAAEVHAASRCAECHGDLYAQWKESKHARAAKSDLYARTQQLAHSNECARCHEPLAKLVEAEHPAARDGVNCDTCHTMSAVDVTGDDAKFRLRPEERRKFGPLCDAVDHYFHKMGCSPLHAESQFCASCHHWSASLAGGDKVRILGEYEEWRESTYAKKGTSCQDCHMPWQVAPVAAGAAARVNASHHGFAGEAADMRQRSLRVTTRVQPSGARLQLEISVKNVGAGHYVPTGIPDHRVVLEAAVVDSAGRELDRSEKSYGKMLVDAAGQPASFFAATKQIADTRLAPEEERHETLDLAAPDGAQAVKVRIVWLDVAKELARAIGHEPVREVMFEETRPLGASPDSPRTGTKKPMVNR